MRRAVDETTSPLGMKCHNVIAELDSLIQAARTQGSVHADITGKELYLATLGIAWSAQYSDSPEKMYEILTRGWQA